MTASSITKNFGLKSRRLEGRQRANIEKGMFPRRDAQVKRYRTLVTSSTIRNALNRTSEVVSRCLLNELKRVKSPLNFVIFITFYLYNNSVQWLLLLPLCY